MEHHLEIISNYDVTITILYPISINKPHHSVEHAALTSLPSFNPIVQGSVLGNVDNFIQWINPNPEDKIGTFIILIGQRANFVHWIGIYPLDKVINSSYNRAQNNNVMSGERG